VSRLGVALVAAAAFLGGVLLTAVLGVEDVVHERTVTRTVHDAATGGGGSQGSGSAVPDVVGESLDQAQDDLDQAGFDTQVEGGGVLGVIIAANWIVIGQDPPAGHQLEPGGTVVLEIQRA
jgi:hypothetical protein